MCITTVLKLSSLSSIATLDLHIIEYNGSKSESDPLVDLVTLALKLWGASLKRFDISLALDRNDDNWFSATGIREVLGQISQAAPQIEFTAEPRSDAFYHRFKSTSNIGLEKAHQAATETLKFSIEFSNRLLASHDFDGAKALLELLVLLRGKMLREKD